MGAKWSQVLVVSAISDSAYSLFCEPEGNELRVEPDDVLTLTFTADRSHPLEISHLLPNGISLCRLPVAHDEGARWMARLDTQSVSLPTTVDGVIARMREIDAELSTHDGVAVFNRMYLTVTERIAAILARPGSDSSTFGDPQTMAELDVRFANLWLKAYDSDAARRSVSPAWRPLFEARGGGRLPVQYAVAGMNSHIEHDLPIAVVETCLTHGLDPEDLHADYEAVNAVLAQVESPIRRSFLDSVGRKVDDQVGPVVHLVSSWDIDKARDVSWVTVEILWALRRTSWVRDRFLDALGHTVGMTTRALLTPTG